MISSKFFSYKVKNEVIIVREKHLEDQCSILLGSEENVLQEDKF